MVRRKRNEMDCRRPAHALAALGIGAILLFSADLALAERAWVIWARDSYTDINGSLWRRVLRGVGFGSDVTTSWEIVAAYPQYAQCQQALAQKWKDIEQSFNRFDKAKLAIKNIEPKLNKSMSARFSNGDSWTITLFCIPDTIDPRISK